MEDEIKEILYLEDYINKYKNDEKSIINGNRLTTPAMLDYLEVKAILDYITNLQEELEDLRENDWAWHQTLKAQNKREYRSKFLKEFQQEYSTNTFPDYDEIYKRYDKVKKENERLKREKIQKELCESLLDECDAHNEYLQEIINKAIEYIMTNLISEWDIENNGYVSGSDLPADAITPILKILKGDEE